MPVRRSDILWAYRSLLGRKPESDRVVDLHRSAADFRTLCESFIASDEFKDRVRPLKRRGGPKPVLALLPPLRIDTAADANELRQLWQRTRQVWTILGERQPFHSILTEDRFTPERWPEFESEFWGSGEAEAGDLVDYLDGLDALKLADSTLLEFGCGVGRVAIPLARSCARVIGYDISASHLALACDRASALGCGNISTIDLGEEVLREFEPCDVFYSRLVLQHNPPPIIGHVLRNLIRALKPGGIGVFQVPTYRVGYRFDLGATLRSPQPSDMEMHCFPQPELFALIAQAGALLIEVREDDTPKHPELFVSNSIVLRKPA